MLEPVFGIWQSCGYLWGEGGELGEGMEDGRMVAMADYPVAAHRPHDCRAYLVSHCAGHETMPRYIAQECFTCGRIVGFRWDSIWLRIWSVFTSEPWGKP